MLRVYIRAMHNRQGPTVTSCEMSLRDALVLVPLVLAILAFALYPQAALDAGEPACEGGRPGRGGERRDDAEGTRTSTGRRCPRSWRWPAARCIVLMVGLLRSRFVRTVVAAPGVSRSR